MKTCALIALTAAAVKAGEGEWLAQFFPDLADWSACQNVDGDYTSTSLYDCAITNVPLDQVANFDNRFDEHFESCDDDENGVLNADELADFQESMGESEDEQSEGSDDDRRRLSGDSDALNEIIRYFPAEADFFANCPNTDGALT